MKDPIETAFESLHITLARLRLLVRLTDENIIDAAGQQDLHDWLHDLVNTAQDQAIEAEKAACTEPGEVSNNDDTQARV